MKPDKLGRYAGVLLVLLLVNTAYIAAFASPTIFYMGNVVLHLALGVALAIMAFWVIRRMPVAGGLFLIAALAGMFLAVRGNTMAHRWVLRGPYRGGRAGAAGARAVCLAARRRAGSAMLTWPA